MAQRAPLILDTDGLPRRMAAGDKPIGFYAKAVATTATGVLTHTIPAGYFTAAPVVVGQVLAPGATRDHILTLTAVTFSADKTVTIAGFVRRSQVLLALGDPTVALTSAVTVHLSAQESD